ncbi:TetR family transcriptional regulator [Bacillus sp. PK3_68]|nr:TetR family transcriptional regulator [Bacillus sp. PK3_68]
MMSYFIDATAQIIEKEGIEKVTIRKVADLAGYNSATIYNYFSDLSHLISFASMKFLKKYTDALPEYLSKAKTPLEKYFLIWECFCKYSFESPQIYYAVFSSDLGVHPSNLSDYYDFFPTDLLGLPENLKDMFLESNLPRRTRIALQQCVTENYIKESEADQLAESHYLIWQGMLTMFINNRSNYSVKEATEMTVKHIQNTITLEESV